MSMQQITLDITAKKKEGYRALEDAQTIVQLCEAVEVTHAKNQELEKQVADLSAKLALPKETPKDGPVPKP